MTLELSRVVALDRLPESVLVEATAPERVALAGRLGIPEVRSVTCRFALRARGAMVQADGVLVADVVQDCVVSLEPVPQRVTERFIIRFVPAGRESDDTDPETPDEIPYEGSTIDLGEAVAEQLALALDPYPRLDGAEMDPTAQDPDVQPFAGLAALRPRT